MRSDGRACGTCRSSVGYEGAGVDPFSELPPEQRDWMRGHCAVCYLDRDYPLVVLLTQDPEGIPCEFWEEG